MFLDIFEFSVENKKNVKGKLFENVVSDVTKKLFKSPQNYF